jgi:hypothetical protein
MVQDGIGLLVELGTSHVIRKVLDLLVEYSNNLYPTRILL